MSYRTILSLAATAVLTTAGMSIVSTDALARAGARVGVNHARVGAVAHRGVYRGAYANRGIYRGAYVRPGVAVGVWSVSWDGRVSVSEESGKVDVALNDLSPGTFQVAVVRLDTCSVQGGLPTARHCQVLSNVVDVTVTEHCQGEGANQVTEIWIEGP